MDVDKPTTSQTGELPAPSSISGSNPPDVRLPEGDPAKSSSHSPTSARQAFPTPTSTNETVIPTTTVRRASITFKLKNYNDGLEKAAVHSTSDMLGPNWAGARLSRASSPALSVQSESSDRGSAIKNNGTRPATFLFTLTTFLRENPKSPYMRWSEDGTYFIVPDKTGLMNRVIPDLFNQNSYSSFARQLNIYGWRRLQASPDGKVTSGNCTIWKHDQINRDTPDDDLKHVKRNAQDKSRRNSKSMDDEDDEYPSVARPRRAVTMSSTTAAEAMAARAAMSIGSTNLRFSSSALTDETKRSSEASTSPPQMPSVLAPVPTRATSAAPAPVPARAAQRPQPPTHTQGRVSRPLPMRRPPARAFSYSGRTMRKRINDASPESAESDDTTDSGDTESEGTFATPTGNDSGVGFSVDVREVKRPRRETDAAISAQLLAGRSVPSSEHAFRVLPFQLAANRQVMPQNPVDVYVACVDGTTPSPPAFCGRDRLDIPIWVDEFSQSRFVLIGDIMRAWALWDIVPPEALLYIALTDASKPPRPLGIAKQLKENKANGDPNIAFSRERIYLETSGEPGCVGQCCLVFRKPTAGEGGDVNGHKASNSISSAISKSNTVPDLQSLRGMVPPVPPTPKIQPQAPTSSERRPLLCETKSGRKISDRFLDSPALFSAGITSRGLPSPAMRTPKTADAISSLAAMQALARSFTPSSSSSSKDVDMTRLPDIQETVPRSLESAEVKSVTMTATQKAAISAGRS